MFFYGEYGLVSLGLGAVWAVFWIWQGINRVIGKQGAWELPPVWVRLLNAGAIIFSLVIVVSPIWLWRPLWTSGTAAVAAGCAATVVLLCLALYASTVLTRILAVHRPGRRFSPVATLGPYAVIRHPMYVLTVLAAWASALSLGGLAGLVAAAAITACYVGVAIWEERSLAAQEGSPYPLYRARVPMFVPRIRFAAPGRPAAPSGPVVSSRTLFEKKRPHRGGKGKR